MPSGDRLGRLYPLAGLADGTGVTPEGADGWAEAVIYGLADAAEGLIGPEDLAARLAAAPPPATGATEAPDSVWSRPTRRTGDKPRRGRGASQF